MRYASFPTATRRIAACLLLMAGCTVGPDFERPIAPDVSGYTPDILPAETASADIKGGEAQRFVQGLDIPGQWWTLFHSEQLNALVQRSLKANPDLQAAQAALRVAQENVYAQEGAYYPNASANFSPSRQKVPNDLASPASSGASYVSLYTASVNVSYALDVFGGTRRQTESLEAQAEAQRFQLEAAYLTLTSNVVGAAVQEASLRGQIAAEEKIVALETEMLNLLRRQRDLGQAAESDVTAQEATLEQARQTLPPLYLQLDVQRNLLTALSGNFPSGAPAETFELSALHLPQSLPLSLPSRLVEQRPDIRAAEANLHAASAQIGVAVANRLPNITLSASDGSLAGKFSQIFTPGTGAWSLAGSLTQPLFDGGTLLHTQRAAEAAYDESAAQYRSTVISAFQNVADVLRALQFDAENLKIAAASERISAKSLNFARARHKLGDISRFDLLNAEQTYQQALVTLAQAQASRYADTIGLFQSLGGGWWNRKNGAAVAEDAEVEQ